MMKITAPRNHLPLAAALLMAATAAPVAGARAAAAPARADYASYEVAFNGTYTYRSTEIGYDVMDAVRTMDASWQSVTSRPLLIARSTTHATGVVTMPSKSTTFTGTYVENVYGMHPFVQSCVLTQDKPGGEGLAGTSTDAAGTVTLDLRPIDHFSGKQSCTRPAGDPDVALLGNDFSVKVSFPADRIGDESIVLPAASSASLPCPSYAFTVTCDASWTGTVTLTRKPIPADEDISDLLTPLTPDRPNPPANTTAGGPGGSGGSTTPAGAGTSTTPTDDDDLSDLIVPLVSPPITDAEIATLIAPLVVPSTAPNAPLFAPASDMRFDAAAVKLWFREACGGGCTGTATLSTTSPAAAHRSSLAHRAAAAQPKTRTAKVTQSFTTHRGTQLVGLRLAAKARANLRKAGEGRLTLTLRDRKSHKQAKTTVILRTK